MPKKGSGGAKIRKALKQPEDKSLAGIAKQTDLIRALVNRTVTYDRIRKQDVTKIHPKLSEVFKKWKTL